MTISYHSGERIQATSADFAGSPAISGGWKEVGRTTWASGNSINVSSLPDKRYYMILNYSDSASNYNNIYRFNSDTGSNYAWRRSKNGGTDSTSTSTTVIPSNSVSTDEFQFTTSYIANLAGKEKLVINHGTDASAVGAGTAPDRTETVGKWANTSDSIDEITMTTTSANYNLGELVVLGWDDSDTHTTNFWEELASVNGTGATSFNSGTFTAKKYLWVQIYVDRSGDASNGEITVGNTTLDTGSNYSRRRSADGGTDDTLTSQTKISLRTAGLKEFYNIFIINNSANEKLLIIHQNAGGTAGAGNAPYRGEFVAKWANTSNQINIIGFGSGGSNTLSSTSIMKVWGHD